LRVDRARGGCWARLPLLDGAWGSRVVGVGEMKIRDLLITVVVMWFTYLPNLFIYFFKKKLLNRVKDNGSRSDSKFSGLSLEPGCNRFQNFGSGFGSNSTESDSGSDGSKIEYLIFLLNPMCVYIHTYCD